MKHATRATIILAAVLATTPSVGAAQEPAASFDQLHTRLEPGERVWVTDARGRETRGTLERVTADSLTLDGSRMFAARDVNLIRHREHDSLKNGTLIGLGIGGGLAVAWCVGAAVDDSPSVSAGVECTEGFTVFGGLGTLLGLGLDAAIPGKMQVVYRALGGTGASSRGRVSTRLVMTPRAQRVAVSLSF